MKVKSLVRLRNLTLTKTDCIYDSSDAIVIEEKVSNLLAKNMTTTFFDVPL